MAKKRLNRCKECRFAVCDSKSARCCLQNLPYLKTHGLCSFLADIMSTSNVQTRDFECRLLYLLRVSEMLTAMGGL